MAQSLDRVLNRRLGGGGRVKSCMGLPRAFLNIQLNRCVMQVSELYQLTGWIEENIKRGDVLSSYRNLHNRLQENAQQGQQQPFENEKEQLLLALNSVPIDKLTKIQLEFIDTMGIGTHIGPASAKDVEDILFRNSIDVATAASKIEEKIQGINEGIGKSDNIRAGLGEYDASDDEIGDDEVMIRVMFSNDANISNVVHLKEWGIHWHDIARGITMMHNAPPEDVRVVGAGKGSLIIELAVACAIAKTIMSIVRDAFEIAKRYVETKSLAERTRAMKIRNQIASQIESEAEEEKNQKIEEIASTIKLAGNDVDGETSNALKKSVRNLVEFLSKGGDLDWVIPEEDSDEDVEEPDKLTGRGELQRILQEIRHLNSDPRQLEYYSNHDEYDGGESGDQTE